MIDNETGQSDLFKVLTPDEEKEYRQWARTNWEHGTDINPLWHPAVRAECAQIQAEYPAALQVARDLQIRSGFTVAAVDSVIKAWRDQAVSIFKTWRHDTMNGCYCFERWGMYVGVEYDGYIHT